MLITREKEWVSGDKSAEILRGFGWMQEGFVDWNYDDKETDNYENGDKEWNPSAVEW